MKSLDLDTLLYVIGAISLLFGFLMLLYYKLTPTIKGPLQWALGSFSVVIGSVLFAGYPLVSGYLAFVVGGITTVASISFYLGGIQLFRGKKVNNVYFYGLIGGEFITSNIFYLVFPSPHLRMATFSLICVVGSLLVISELLRPARKDYRLAYILVSVVFGISATTSLFRAVAVLIIRPEEANTPISANLIFYFFASVTQVLLLFSFLLLISIKIAESLEQKVQDQRKFYSIIAHDLSGPVGMINMMLNMANQDSYLDSQQKAQMLSETEKLSTSTYHLLQNLLFWSRNQLEDLKPHFGKFDLNKAIVENIDLMRQISKSKNVDIVYAQPEDDLFCYGDERMIHTVLRNLISNAVKFSHSGGIIDISVEKAEMLAVKISDNGVGMSKEALKNLFVSGKGKTTSGTAGERGTGLGLMLAKEFVEGNKGSIGISSKEGEGTEVVVRLLVADS